MPPNLNQQIQTLLLRRAVMQTRYENAVLRTFAPYWQDAQASMLAAVRGSGISAKDAGPVSLLRGAPLRLDQQQRVQALMVQLIGIWRYALDRAVQTLHTNLVDFAELELIEVPQAIQALLDRARLPLREAEEEEPLSGTLSATFTQVPAAQIAQLLTSPLGGAFFAQSFGDLSAQVLAQLRNALNLGLLQGQGIPAVTRAVMAVMGSSRWKAERIVRSEYGRVAAQAAQLQFKQNERLLRGVQWLATLDQRTCVECGNLDGRTWADPAAAPIPVVSTHPNCFAEGTKVSGSFLLATRFQYVGRIITVKTRQGCVLRVTPNHPILTPRGMVPAHLLHKGDYVISRRLDGHGKDDQNMPVPIEEVFRAFRQNGFWQPARLHQEDFHGDALGGQGEIDVVALDRELLDDAVTAFAHGSSDFGFHPPDEGEVGHLGLGATDHFGTRSLRPTDSIMRSSRLGQALLPVHPRPLQTLSVGAASELHAAFAECREQWSPSDAGFVAQLLQRSAGAIAFDQIIELRYDDHNGHVYDLQSESGAILAEDIVTSNCRCVLIPLIRGLPGVEFPTSTRASMDGQVSATLTYKDWFGQQDAEFQRTTLGPTRYRLWKSGALKLGDFSTATGVRSVKDALALARSRA